MAYQSEITKWMSKKDAKFLMNKIAGCGFVTVYDEVSNRKVVNELDMFRVVMYTPLIEDLVCKKLGIEKSELTIKSE